MDAFEEQPDSAAAAGADPFAGGEPDAAADFLAGKFLFPTTFVFYVMYGLCIRCGHVVRDFESEAKTRCNFQFW